MNVSIVLIILLLYYKMITLTKDYILHNTCIDPILTNGTFLSSVQYRSAQVQYIIVN